MHNLNRFARFAALGLILGLVASTEIKVEYDSGAADDADDTDTTYSLKLGYQW